MPLFSPDPAPSTPANRNRALPCGRSRARQRSRALERATSRQAVAGLVMTLAVALIAGACSAASSTAPGASGGKGLATPTAVAQSSSAPTQGPVSVAPPKATPLAAALAEPAGDGTKVSLETADGTIVIELFTESSPVAAENFANLAAAGFYDGVVFHRILPGFMIQGGDPTGTGGGGPGYQFVDEPFAGEYVRGMVAMANAGADTNGSQFFILVADYPLQRDYTIFGRVVEGMEAVDQIVAGPRGGPKDDQALEPVAITKASVERP